MPREAAVKKPDERRVHFGHALGGATKSEPVLPHPKHCTSLTFTLLLIQFDFPPAATTLWRRTGFHNHRQRTAVAGIMYDPRPFIKSGINLQLQTAFQEENWVVIGRLAERRWKETKDQYYDVSNSSRRFLVLERIFTAFLCLSTPSPCLVCILACLWSADAT